MAEVLAAGASIVTILGLVKACIDIYDKIAEATRAGADLDQVVAQLRIERLRFFLWCQDARLIDGILLLDDTRDPKQIDQVALWEAVSPEIHPEFVLDELRKIMHSFVQTMKESNSLLQAYFTTRPATYLTQLKGRMRHGSRSSALVANVYLDGNTSATSLRKQMSTMEKLKWNARDKKALKALVELLHSYNDGLLNVLSMAQKIRHGRQIQLLATTSPVDNIILAAHGGERQSTLPLAERRRLLPTPADPNHDVLRLINLSRRSNLIEYSASELQHSTSELPQPYDNAERHLFASALVLNANEQVRRNRVYTLYNNRPVVLEWKYYSQRIKPDVLAHLRQRVDLLSLQLAQSSRTTGFSTLDCIGHYEDEVHRRMAIVFAYPDGQDVAKPVSLKEQLSQGQANHSIPDHDQRLRTAASLALTFYRLHSVGWLHKSLRSDNILFFNPSDQDPHLLTHPYVCGFDFSRQDSPNELTENIPSVLLQQYNDLESKIYRHPDLDYQAPDEHEQETLDSKQKAIVLAEKAAADFRYKKSYDIYSLGILLLEIGHWCPATSMGRSQNKIADFRMKVYSKYLPELRYRMGKKYHDVTELCLKGAFDTEVDEVESAAATGRKERSYGAAVEVDELRERREWLESFERHAVRVLEEAAAAAA